MRLLPDKIQIVVDRKQIQAQGPRRVFMRAIMLTRQKDDQSNGKSFTKEVVDLKTDREIDISIDR